MSSVNSSLVGKFFRSFDASGRPEHRGRILSRPEQGTYLCQLLNRNGELASGEKLAPLSAMSRWAFYSSETEWSDAHHGSKNHSSTLFERRDNPRVNNVFSRRSETDL